MSELKEINEVKETLKEIYEKGFEIRNVLKEKYNYISLRSKTGILIDPGLFYYSLFESFWNLFKIVSENIENPLVQPWIRVIIEQSSDIFWYSQKNENEKKDIACIYWLCALGFVGGKQRDLNYDDFLDILDDPKKKTKFLELKKGGYPIKKIHNEWHHLFPSVSEDCLPSFMEKYFLNMGGNFIKKSQLDHFYRDMSLYHHPSILMNKLEEELSDRSHLFRCFALISFCGMSLIKFTTEEIIDNPTPDFIEELNKKINLLFKKLYLERKNQK